MALRPGRRRIPDLRAGHGRLHPARRARPRPGPGGGVDDRLRFERRDVSGGLPERFDVILTLDVIHDAVDPLGILRAIREALTDDGVYLCLDINCSDKLEENAGPLGAMFLSFSVLYCMTTSLAHDGAGLGTFGLHEPKLRELATAAGFGTVKRVEMDNPLNNLYELRR